MHYEFLLIRIGVEALSPSDGQIPLYKSSKGLVL